MTDILQAASGLLAQPSRITPGPLQEYPAVFLSYRYPKACPESYEGVYHMVQKCEFLDGRGEVFYIANPRIWRPAILHAIVAVHLTKKIMLKITSAAEHHIPHSVRSIVNLSFSIV